jgi:hypothetical protein
MNAKTLEVITRHGETLLRAFPNATEKSPVALCKKLRRIENAVAKPILDYTNGENGVTLEKLDIETNKAETRIEKLLGDYELWWSDCPVVIIHINRDPRGHALKLNDAWTRQFNATQYAAKLPALYTDMGGYGILAPDLTSD